MQAHGKEHLGGATGLFAQNVDGLENFVPLNVALAMFGRSGGGCWGFRRGRFQRLRHINSSPHFTQRTCSFCGAGGYGTSGIEISQEIEPGANANSCAKKTCEALGIEHLQGTKRLNSVGQ